MTTITGDMRKKMVQSIINFLRKDSNDNKDKFGNDLVESVEVAVQCLEQAYGLPWEGESALDLKEIYSNAAKQLSTSQERRVVSAEEKEKADDCKVKGNALMADQKFMESVEFYTKAIELNPYEPVYFCNRAAAFSKLDQFNKSIEDCRKALELQPNYAKAYGRMGLAYSCMQMHENAIECYEKALKIDPNNAGFQKNLETAKGLKEKDAATIPNPLNNMMNNAGLGSFLNASGGGAPDLSSLLNNPELLDMASTLMTNPNMQSMMSTFLGSMTGLPDATAPPGSVPASTTAGATASSTAATATSTSETSSTAAPASSNAAPPASSTATTSTASNQTSSAPNSGLEALFSAGRQLAEQMQNQHPDLIEQLRSRNQPPPQP